MKKFIIIVIIVAAVGFGWWLWAHEGNDKPEFQTAKVTRGDVTQSVTATGTLNPMTNVTVGSQISGIIQKLYADWNSPVKAGQVVAQLDAATYKAAVAQAEGDLANAKANLELAGIQSKRAEDLFKDKLISASDHDTAIANLHQAEAQVKIKEAQLANSKVSLERCTIYSPVDGTVVSRNVDIGQTVAASLSAPTLFIIANDLSQMQIDAAVSEADIGTIEEGQTTSFTVDAFTDRKFTGKVRQIRNSPTTVQNVVTYDTVVDVKNPDLKLRPGMTANASIITAEKKGVLRIPNGALRFKPPEPSTNHSFAARVFAKIGLVGKLKTTETKVAATTLGDTNKAEAGASAPLTGNETPEELVRRMREFRERGEDPPADLRAKMRELYQSGAIPRPGGGGGESGGGRPPGAGMRQRTGPASRMIYILGTNSTPDVPVLQQVRVKTGISDGAFTEVTDGLNEGDVVVTGVKQPAIQQPAAPPGQSPFGGGGGFRRGM